MASSDKNEKKCGPREDNIVTCDLETNTSPGNKKKKEKKQARYRLEDKSKVIELIEKGKKTCDIVRMTGISENTIRRIEKKKDEGESDGDTQILVNEDVDSSYLDDLDDYDFPIPKCDAQFRGFSEANESDEEMVAEEGN